MAERPGKQISIVAADLRFELERGTSKAELMKMWKCKKVELERAIERYGINPKTRAKPGAEETLESPAEIPA